jgi:hypothetical protein
MPVEPYPLDLLLGYSDFAEAPKRKNKRKKLPRELLPQPHPLL